MAESALALNFQGFANYVGRFLGYGGDLDSFTDEQMAQVRVCIAGGERRAYDPEKHPQEAVPHTWSFLRPTRTLLTVTSIDTQDLPDDYGAMLGDLTVQTTTGWYWPIKLVGEGKIREMRTRGLASANGRIQMGAVRCKPVSPIAPQRFEILWWPKPDSVYTIEYRCLVNPMGMSEQNPWPYGGMHFCQTLLEACLAEAELQLNNEYGLHNQQFLQRIVAAAQVDKQQARAEYIGYNDDPSTPESRKFGGKQLAFPDTTVTYMGQQY